MNMKLLIMFWIPDSNSLTASTYYEYTVALRRPPTNRPWCGLSPVTDCPPSTLYWAYDDNILAGDPFVPEPWMTQYISSMYFPKNVHTGAIMKMRVEPMDIMLETAHFGRTTAYFICSAHCLFDRVEDVYEI